MTSKQPEGTRMSRHEASQSEQGTNDTQCPWCWWVGPDPCADMAAAAMCSRESSEASRTMAEQAEGRA